MSFAKINNIDIYYEVHGEGEPLILIAGFTADSQSWQFVINDLSKHFKVIIFDNRGVGRTEDTDSPYTIEQMADDTKGLMDYLNIHAAHILGHSMGGYIAQKLAIKYPERIYKLILCSTSPFATKRNNIFFQSLLELSQNKADQKLWWKLFIPWLFTTKNISQSKFVSSFLQYVLDYPYPQTQKGIEGQINALINFDVVNELSKIQSETLILVGEEDILIPPTEADKLYKGITRAGYPVYIEGAAHSIHNEQPKEFYHTVMGFIFKFVR
ncbi:MAG: alpha/beta hydrolase [Bacteroidales bacterium]|nr:alpha/beta hydrolase [Bacteroidales bacterium]